MDSVAEDFLHMHVVERRMMQVVAPAKINLGLHVLRRRGDGYHDIETVFLRIGWYDTLRIEPSDRLELHTDDPDLPVDARNLCLQAAHRLQEAGGITAGACIHLEKRIPVQAGLGGGSSDAAATLQALNRFWGLYLPEETLHRLALSLGSDVPFFLRHTTAAYATGRGEHLEVLPSFRFPYALVVVKPSCSVSTAEAYRWVTPRDEGRPDLKALVGRLDPERWRTELVNDFEPWVLRACPEVGEVKQRLYDAGALYASLSGSGSAVFGVFASLEAAEAAFHTFQQSGYTVWQGMAW